MRDIGLPWKIDKTHVTIARFSLPWKNEIKIGNVKYTGQVETSGERSGVGI